MVVIRLARGGSKKRPFYQIVVADRRRAPRGRFIENVGYYNPMAKGQSVRLEMKTDRIEHWLSKGAQASERVASLIKDNSQQAA